MTSSRTAVAGVLAAAVALGASGGIGAARPDVHAAPAFLTVQSAPDARALLASLAGTPPVACELALRTLGNRWGSSLVRPRVHAPLAASDRDRSLAEWAWSGSPSDADADALVDGLGAQDPCVRRVAASLLTNSRDPDMPGRLAARARATVGPERLATIRALAGRRGPVAEASLLGFLSSGDVELRRAAAWGLGTIEADGAVPALQAALTDPDEALRENAAWALGNIESRTSVAALVAALRDASPGVRVNAAWGLGRIEDREAIPALGAVLTSDQVRDVRIAAAWALAHID